MPENVESVESLLVARCRALIDIPSVSRDEAAVERYIKAALPPSFELIHDDDTVFLASKARRPGHELVVIAGHTDTVPIEDNVPSCLEDRVIRGRGASDMKSALAVMIELARWIDEIDQQPPFDVAFLFFGREELPAGECPLLAAIESSSTLREAAFAILMEPTANALEAGCQGNLNLALTYEGKAAHSARPWAGSNAVHSAITALQQVAAGSMNTIEVQGLEFQEVVSITGMRGGVARNVIPPSAEVDVNIRYAPSRDPEEAAKHWRQVFEATGAGVEVVSNARPAPVVVDHPIARSLRAAGASEVVPKQAWTNAADFAALDVPAINFGPGDPKYAHRRDEQVEVSALVESFTILQRLLAGI